MSIGFDWRLLRLPCWTPISRFNPAAERILGEFYASGPGVYLMANSSFGGTGEDPGVGAVLWARSRSVALLIYERTAGADLDADGACEPPPAEVVGFDPLNYGSISAFPKGRGEQPVATADCRFPDGVFVVSRIVVNEREYIFSSTNPSADERPIGIQFDLP